MSFPKVRSRRRFLVVAGTCVSLFVLTLLVACPLELAGEERGLTGTPLEWRALASFDRKGREGSAAYVYQISERAADALNANRASLRRYPLRSGLLFDGYRRVCWQTLGDLSSGPDRIIAETTFRNAAAAPDVARIATEAEARELARSLAHEPDVLISGWYTERGGVMTNYVLYVLDPKRRVLVKLWLLT